MKNQKTLLSIFRAQTGKTTIQAKPNDGKNICAYFRDRFDVRGWE